jgi:hypothetical protein
MEHFEQALFYIALAFFSGWLSILTHQVSKLVNNIAAPEDLDETKQTVQLIAQAIAVIHENMPTMDRIRELVPEFTIQQEDSGSKYFFDFLGKYFMDSSNTPKIPRDDRGQFHGPPQIPQDNDQTPSETDAEGFASN